MDVGKKSGKGNRFIVKLSDALKKNKSLEIAFYVGLVVIVLVLYLSTLFAGQDKKATSENINEASAYIGQDVENKLSAVLSKIEGAGQVDVMITYDTGPEMVPAMSMDINTNSSENTADGKISVTENQTTSQKPVTISGNGGSSPMVLTEKQPIVRGVIVVAEGAADIAVRLNLNRAVQAVLNVPQDCIEVFVREKQGIQTAGRE